MKLLECGPANARLTVGDATGRAWQQVTAHKARADELRALIVQTHREIGGCYTDAEQAPDIDSIAARLAALRARLELCIAGTAANEGGAFRAFGEFLRLRVAELRELTHAQGLRFEAEGELLAREAQVRELQKFAQIPPGGAIDDATITAAALEAGRVARAAALEAGAR